MRSNQNFVDQIRSRSFFSHKLSIREERIVVYSRKRYPRRYCRSPVIRELGTTYRPRKVYVSSRSLAGEWAARETERGRGRGREEGEECTVESMRSMAPFSLRASPRSGTTFFSAAIFSYYNFLSPICHLCGCIPPAIQN